MPFLADHLAGVVLLAREADDVVIALDTGMDRIAAERAEAAGDAMQDAAGEFLVRTAST